MFMVVVVDVKGEIMAWLIMNDELDYTSTWYPTHIISKENKLVPVFIGAAQTMLHGYIGIYVRDADYKLLRHDKTYIFIHDPDATNDDIEKIEWDKVPDCKSQKTTNRQHFHLFKETEFKGVEVKGGNA